MAKFLKTPYRTVIPEVRLDPMSKRMVQDPPYRVYMPVADEELAMRYREGSPQIIEVSEQHAEQVLRKQKGYQEIDEKRYDAANVGLNKNLGPRRSNVSKPVEEEAPTPKKRAPARRKT